MPHSIAIDGPSGSGKSTAAKIVARRLNFRYIDTGAMYRAVTLSCLRRNLTKEKEEQIARTVKNIEIDFGKIQKDGNQEIYLNGENIAERIREQDIDQNVSDIASIPVVREIMLYKQRKFARQNDVIMDGRDIGTRVLPDADLKIYLTASLVVRTNRRFKELDNKGKDISRKKVRKNLEARDKKDSNREHSPLSKAINAVEINSNNLSPEQVADRIIELFREEVKS